MINDPIFIISVIGMTFVLGSWIKSVINNESNENNFVVKNSSSLSTIFGLLMLYSIFVNAGDLGIVLLISSIVSLIVLLIDFVFKN